MASKKAVSKRDPGYPTKSSEEYGKHRKTGSVDLDEKLSRASFSNSKAGGVREVVTSRGNVMPEGVRKMDGNALGYNEARRKYVRTTNRLVGVVTDRRGYAEVPNVNIPGIEKKAKRVTKKVK